MLIKARAPLDHVNNLGWTALIEAIVLGDGGARHQATVEVLIKGGANLNLAGRQRQEPARAGPRRRVTRRSRRCWSRRVRSLERSLATLVVMVGLVPRTQPSVKLAEQADRWMAWLRSGQARG